MRIVSRQIKAQGMSKPIDRFADTVRRFCRWAESEPQDPVSEARTARRFLAELYLQAIDLPEGSPDADATDIAQEQYQSAYKRFGALPFNYYSECFNPLATRAEHPVTANLADDLDDILRDLKRGMALYENGHAEAAAWEWSFNFNAHWGHHACGALYALQTWFSLNNCDFEDNQRRSQ
ncbi:MAG TPA: DUF5063 domain-containing protein [Blastocatellia bacterium]